MTQRQPRLLDPGYLAWLRERPCIACRRPPRCDAAHLKMAWPALDKPFSGSLRPDDKYAMPLCRSCHMRQHAHGDELGWWVAQGFFNPPATALKYYAQYGGTGGNARGRRKIKPRKPRHLRAKLTSRNTLRKAKR